ncbi:hypothetical protein JAAARDRAFT_423938 [Jaapia argillacea MUCL 33604]|uniref:Uncharacterized protein n=1 Tax=Jaapia argillacea MUCL 33604 TaxID=933084 RepID=A0A067PG77_9AGAM|nr:hypothetical protein JAAARDRAFT_423938 [Jaapia argillacea MUCL 33604]
MGSWRTCLYQRTDYSLCRPTQRSSSRPSSPTGSHRRTRMEEFGRGQWYLSRRRHGVCSLCPCVMGLRERWRRGRGGLLC